ncbi:MAG: hypothetical protein JNM55_03890 [Anaerolineales bacterium]|nr:hypothetical protein [Anaerolineales bacterium]
MAKDQAYRKAEKRIAKALQSGATDIPARYPFFHLLFNDYKGDNYGSE